MEAKTGDQCQGPGCCGQIRIYSTKARGELRVQYLECAECRKAAGKITIAATSVRKRRPKEKPV